MNTALTVHLYVGFLVALAAVLAIWTRNLRRIALYVVSAQILIGIGVLVAGYRVPPVHWLLGLAGAGLWMASNVVERRGNRGLALGLAIVGSLCLLGTFGIGQAAVKGG